MRTPGLALVRPPVVEPQERVQPRVGVVVNASSRQVSERLLHLLPEVVPSHDLYVTHLAADTGLLARRVLERRYDTVFVGGGDRTFATLTTALLRQGRGSALPVPRLGLLRLGNTHGMATLVRASGRGGRVGLLDDVLRARSGEVPGYRSLDLLEVEGGYTPAAGLGLSTLLSRASSMGRGSFLSGLASVELEVQVGRGEAVRLDAAGAVIGDPLPSGSLLFRGRVTVAAAGCVPFLGEGHALFPHALREGGRMHLRLGTPSGRLASLLPGRAKLHDFLVSEVTLHFGREVPVNLGPSGTAMRHTLHLQVAPQAVELCDFSHALH